MTNLFTVAAQTGPEDVEAALDALRSADIPAWRIHLADKNLDLVSAGFPDDGERPLPSPERLEELDARVVNTLAAVGISADVVGHGRSTGDEPVRR